MPTLEFSQRPTWLQRSEVAGVFVGGCVIRGDGSSFRARAHAHTHDSYKGWICYRSPKRLGQKMLALHELAHVLVLAGHTDKWRAKLHEIGGRISRHNRRRLRKKCACGSHRYASGVANFYADDPVHRFHSWAECRRRTE